jgi:hypothetical protein
MAKNIQDEIFLFLKSGKIVRDSIGEVLEQKYQFNGKNLQEWRREFHIPMHADMNSQDVIACGAKASQLGAEVTFYLNNANSTCQVLEADYERRMNESVAEIVDSLSAAGVPKKEWPSVEAIKAKAAAQFTDLWSALVNAQIVRDFWDNLRKYLDSVRFSLQTTGNQLINIRKNEKDFE